MSDIASLKCLCLNIVKAIIKKFCRFMKLKIFEYIILKLKRIGLDLLDLYKGVTKMGNENNKNSDISVEESTSNPFAASEEDKTAEAKAEDNQTIDEEIENKVEEKEAQQEDKTAKELETMKAQYLRLAADFDNYRKRQAQERESLLKYGAEDTVKKLLPLIDTFDRAKKSLNEMDDPEKIKESFEVVYKQLVDCLEKVGVKKIETEGKDFDPMFHEAVMQTPTSEHKDNTIINELQSGFKLSDRVVRAALVNVAVSE